MQAMSVVMHLNSVETLTSPYLEVALRGCLFLQHFLAGGGVDCCYACSKTFMKHIIGKPFK